MRTIKILALDTVGRILDLVVDFLKCFPCVEKLYIMSYVQKSMKNVRIYNQVNPIECLELHLKKVVITNYRGMRPDVNFAKFFILNAKVLWEMDFGVINYCNDNWMANQHRRLQLDNQASPEARFAFGDRYRDGFHTPSFLPMADPFEWKDYEIFLRFARMVN